MGLDVIKSRKGRSRKAEKINLKIEDWRKRRKRRKNDEFTSQKEEMIKLS